MPGSWEDYVDLAGQPYEWKHGYIPVTPRAAAIKAKKQRGKADDGPAKMTPEALALLSPAQQKAVRAGEKPVKTAQTSEGTHSRLKGTTKDLSKQKTPGTVSKARKLAIAAGLPAGIADDPAKAAKFLAEVIKREKTQNGETENRVAPKRAAISRYLNLLKKQNGG